MAASPGLDLQNNNLTGSIPPELGSLPMLQSLDLRNNNLGGPIPPELANASNLERLFLAPNNFTGCIPRQLAHLEKFFPQHLFDRIRRVLLFPPSPDRSDLGDVDLYYCVENPGLPINSALSAPSNLSYAYQGSTIVISWDPVDGADRYNLYHDDALDSSCRLSPSGKPKFCDYLATVLAETTYTHADPAAGRNYYWVIACNSSGCSPLDAENAASPPADTPYRPGLDYPPAPSNLTYAFEGSSVVINWDPVDDADYYNLYHHDSFATYCNVQSDGSSSSLRPIGRQPRPDNLHARRHRQKQLLLGRSLQQRRLLARRRREPRQAGRGHSPRPLQSHLRSRRPLHRPQLGPG